MTKRGPVHIIYDDTTPSEKTEYTKKPVFEDSTIIEERKREQEKENITVLQKANEEIKAMLS